MGKLKSVFLFPGIENHNLNSEYGSIQQHQERIVRQTAKIFYKLLS